MAAGKIKNVHLLSTTWHNILQQSLENHPTSAGEVLAQEKVRMKLTISQDGTRLSGTLLVEIRDFNDNIVFVGPGTFEATRIKVEPLTVPAS